VPGLTNNQKISLPFFVLTLLILIFAFYYFAEVTLSSGTLSTENGNSLPSISTHTNIARLIYESESIVGLLASMIVAGTALFASLALMFWHQNIDSVFGYFKYTYEKLEYYGDRNDKIKTKRLSTLLNKIENSRERLEGARPKLAILYILVFILSSLVILLLIVFRLSFPPEFNLYLILRALMGAILVLVLLVLATIIVFARVARPHEKLEFQRELSEILREPKSPPQKDKPKRTILYTLIVERLVPLIITSLSAFSLAIILGRAVVKATGIPLTGGIINGIIVGIILTLGVKYVDKFGSATILWLLFASLSIPTDTLGPSGIYKLLVGFLAGISWDIFISVFRRKNIGYIVGGGFGSAIIVVSVFLAGVILNLPNTENLIESIVPLLIFNSALGSLSVYFGVLIHDKYLANFKFIKGEDKS